MKTYLQVFIAFLLLLSTTQSRAQSYLWARQGKSTDGASGAAIATDNSGNVYVAGSASGITFFDDKQITGNLYPNTSMFVAKYNGLGKIQWVSAESPIDTDTDYNSISTDVVAAKGIVVNKLGEIYVLASVLNVVDIGGFRTTSNQLIIGKDTITPSDYTYTDYIVKYSASGVALWAQPVNSDYSENFVSFHMTTEGHLLVALLGTGTFTGDYSVSRVLTYDSSGTLLNTTPLSVALSDFTIDSLNNWYITGIFFDSLSLGKFLFKSTNNNQNAYVAKLTSAGAPLWVKPSSSKGFVNGQSIQADKKGHIYVAGSGNDTLQFDDITLNQIYSNDFIARFDTAGNGKWIEISNGTITAVGSNSTIYIASQNGVYAVDSAGAGKWNTTAAMVTAIAPSRNGALYVTGNFFGVKSFGSATLVSDSSITDAFVAAIVDSTVNYASGNKISGTLFNDLNKNCIKDGPEKGIAGHTIAAAPGPYFAVTDSNGAYTLNVDTGTYTVSQLTAVSDSISYSQLCPSSLGNYSITFKNLGQDSTAINFADTTFNCPILGVRFFDYNQTTNNYYGNNNVICYNLVFATNTTISYYNTGNAPAYGVKIYLYYPYGITIGTSSMPYTVVNDTVVYYTIDTLNALGGGKIYLTDVVSCSASINETFTYYATISPKNCLPQDTIYNSSYTQKNVSVQLPNAVVSPSFATSVTLYPNPTKGNFTLLFKEANSYQITVYNNLGQQVQTANINGTEASLSLDNAAQGIYYVKIISSKGSATKKLIVE